MKKLFTKEDINELLYASTASAALGAAIETGLLWLLAKRPMGGDGVAQALSIPVKRCCYWLQLLHSLGILEKVPQGYAPSPLACSAIIETMSQESWAHLIVDERERTTGVQNLALTIREPGSIWAAQGLTEPRHYVEKMRVDPERANEFTRMLYEIHQYLGNEIAGFLDMTGVHRLMDLGGGSGVVSMALLRKYPDLIATVVDIENVCMAGREIAQEQALSDRISYYPADFERDEFPTGFDMVIKCDVGYFDETIYHKVWTSLNSGGRLILVDHFSPAENLAPTERVEWSFLDSLENPNFSIPTSAQVRAQLAQAGFYVIPGERTLSTRRLVIQAQRL